MCPIPVFQTHTQNSQKKDTHTDIHNLSSVVLKAMYWIIIQSKDPDSKRKASLQLLPGYKNLWTKLSVFTTEDRKRESEILASIALFQLLSLTRPNVSSHQPQGQRRHDPFYQCHDDELAPSSPLGKHQSTKH